MMMMMMMLTNTFDGSRGGASSGRGGDSSLEWMRLLVWSIQVRAGCDELNQANDRNDDSNNNKSNNQIDTKEYIHT